jgi:chorismate--pyruvate lyase
MDIANVWSATPPEVAPDLLPFLTETGSLTALLIDTGREFSVAVQRQSELALHPDEIALLGAQANDPGYVREVTLHLDGIPVVVARSVTRTDCLRWRQVLERGARSLGFTLFGELTEVEREPLQYAWLDAAHPLHRAAAECQRENAHYYPARRSRFLLDGMPLIVCETFLPSLLELLP